MFFVALLEGLLERLLTSLSPRDNYLSAALGRPRTFHDDDIDQVSFILDWLPQCSDIATRNFPPV